MNRKQIYRLLISIIFIFIFSISESFTQFVFKPYLQGVTDSSVAVIVVSRSKVPPSAAIYDNGQKIKEIKSQKYEKVDADKSIYAHRIYIGGLVAGKEYQYMVQQGKDASDFNLFKTAVRPDNSFRMLVMGDNRSNPKVFNKISGLMKEAGGDFSVYLGDLCYKPDFKYWKDEFFVENQQELAASVPFFNAVGNHEDWAVNTKAFTQSPGNIQQNDAYYKVEYGDALILILNTEVGVTPGTSQWKFVEKELKKFSGKWKIAAFHIPAYCGGGHGDNRNMKRMTSELFEPNGVDMVLAGHSHFYQRNFVNGIYHLIIASAGAPLYSPKDQSYTQKSAKKYHFAVFDVSPEKITCKVIGKEGETIDEFEITK